MRVPKGKKKEGRGKKGKHKPEGEKERKKKQESIKYIFTEKGGRMGCLYKYGCLVLIV